VPKTIDNDLSATDYSFGFDTAVQVATEAMDRLRTTGDSHGRCMVAEVMGRHVGWIALHSGMAAGAHTILIPEQRTSLDQVCAWVQSALDRGRATLVAVAEGFQLDSIDDPHSYRGLDAFGRPRLGGIGDLLATRYGMAVIEAVVAGAWGRMVALRGTDIVTVPFEDALGELKSVPPAR
jgi:6-phosphofructokinase